MRFFRIYEKEGEENMDDYRPTQAELGLINQRYAKQRYESVDDLYVFWTLSIDNQLVPERFVRFDISCLKQFVKNINEESVSFLIGHSKDRLPIARAFKAKLVKAGEVVDFWTKQFMQKDLSLDGDIQG